MSGVQGAIGGQRSRGRDTALTSTDLTFLPANTTSVWPRFLPWLDILGGSWRKRGRYM
jgi:hypothetical protein